MRPSLITVLTIGHSTKPLEAFAALLKSHSVVRLVDVRKMPRSRHNPQFNGDALATSLASYGIGYVHFPGLGGLRRTKANSSNTGWRNASFRAYADYMQTAEFTDNLEKLVAMAKHEQVALMCAEAVPWRCHRSLIADALLVRNINVEEILSHTRCEPHQLTPFARVAGTSISYPPMEPAQQELF
ncbi:MAG: DUF488 domain-containing protein [Methylophilaceae bacterium]